MERSSLQNQAAAMKKSFFDQGYLDEQFYQLEELQDDASPNFVEEVVALFLRDSSRLIGIIEQAMDKHPQDYSKLETYMHQLKGSSSSIGALKVKNECTHYREYCAEDNLEGCLRSFQKLKREHAILKQKLEAYFQLLKQTGSAGKATKSEFVRSSKKATLTILKDVSGIIKPSRHAHHINQRSFLTLVTALIFGSILWRIGHKRDTSSALTSY